MDEFTTVILRFVKALDLLNIEYFVGGSVASISYGPPRMTRDVGFIVTLRKEYISTLVDALTPMFYVDRLAVARAVEEVDCFNAIDREFSFQIDVLVPHASPWLESQFARKRLTQVGNDEESQIYICSAEDSVLSKLVWYKAGNEVSQAQWADAVGVVRTQLARLDSAYLRKWADELGVGDLLGRAMDAAKA